MPDGLTHYRYFKRFYIAIIPVSVAGGFISASVGLGLLAGYTSGRWIDPDWDLMGASSAEGRMVRELPVVGHFLFGIASTYGSMFRKHHRQFITHFPFISTAIRLMFVGLPLYFILKSYDFNFRSVWFQLFVLGFWIGLSLADAIHFALDLLFKGE